MEKIHSFHQLVTWQKAHALVLVVYKITKLYPREEQYVLVPQIRRCAISITSNIAEGFSRWSLKEKIQFYFIALGSLTELENQLMISRDLAYINKQQYEVIEKELVVVQKLLNALITSIRK